MPVFGKKKKASTPEESIHKMKEARELLEKKQSHLEKLIDQEVLTAKKYAKSNKRLALNALKKKKKLENDLTRSDAILGNIDLLLDQLEQSHMNAQVTNAMHQAATTLQQQQKANNLDKIEDMMYDIEDQIQQGEAVNDALSRQIGYGADIDEDDLESELNDLMQEDLDRELLEIGADDLPAVPNSSLPSVSNKQPAEDEDEDLKELEAFAAAA